LEYLKGQSFWFDLQIMHNKLKSLMDREPARLDEAQIRSTIEGRVVLVTGSAGSIGAELCRQIARFKPAAIVGFEIAETPLFDIDREMRQEHSELPFYAEIGNVQNLARLNDVFSRYRPALVYHAAAYKHVPLMEEHPFEAIENNVFGTENVARASREFGADRFILISSDKAVRPTSVMGATKRVSELLLQSQQNDETQFIAVRFGNVLDSQGSVIHIFKKQIAAGGPVTVTHPEMRRYFMTIAEACQLVLQASAIGAGGQICVLEIGEPIKIVDLARDLIQLAGLKLDEDIKIEFTGVRPGEKLYEEMASMLDNTVSSNHEHVRLFVNDLRPQFDFDTWVRSLAAICSARDTARLVAALREMVVDYTPSEHLLNGSAAEPANHRPQRVRTDG
jgi:FlaA1/EpsC-like NDP-sugar epimerase